MRPTSLLLLALIWLASACAPADTSASPTPEPSLTPSPSPTETPPVLAGSIYVDVPQSATGLGFPQLGLASAPVSVLVFNAFDCESCISFAAQIWPVLVGRAQAGEVLLTYVPLVTGQLPNGEAAASAALCAGQQNAFWPYYDRLVALLSAEGAQSLTPERLAAAAAELGLEGEAWQTCLLSSRPATILTNALTSTQQHVGFGGAPAVFVDAISVNADALAIDAAINIALAERLATGQPSPTPDPNAPVVITLAPLQDQPIPPPIALDLPAGWRVGHDTLLLGDVVGMRSMPFSVYTGPIAGGTGSIVLLWGFPNLAAGNPFQTGAAEVDLFADGLRLLRLAVVEQGCNIGTDLRRSYSLGGLNAIGTEFAAVTCPELPDTRGWFAGLQQNDINFIFYAYADPIEAMNTGREQLQAILDSVRFTLPPSVTPTPAP